ncbi:MAG TPA: cytochrome c-type biogenesis protein [Gemmatimonadaceae bacterium]|nr:cytochrome c-type biogenesis protein [Gemmatimonadaceae bacterium]
MRRTLSRFGIAACLLAAPLRAQQPAARDAATVDAQAREIAGQLRCPVCQGESIKDSPSPLAQEMRQVVREQLAAGRTPDEVKQYFVAKYGEWILLAPEASGFNLLVYALPFAMLLGGGAVVALAVRRWTRSPAGPAAPPDEDSAAGPAGRGASGIP